MDNTPYLSLPVRTYEEAKHDIIKAKVLVLVNVLRNKWKG